jgi:hypothetical protein
MLLPKAISYYRSIRAGPPVTSKPIRPVPSNVNRALTILFTVSVIYLVSTFPFFSPENIFATTQSRLQIPTDVLFTRLASPIFRPHGLTDGDNALRQKFVSLDSRLLYFKFGPDVLSNCLFCNVEDPRSYLYYALPSVLVPHIFNLCVLGLVTSGLFVGNEGTVWRKTATYASIVVAGLDLYTVSTYDQQENARATRLEDVQTFFWRMRLYRGVGIAAMDALLGWVLYLSSTNRAFVTPLTTVERLESATRELEMVRSKMGAMGVMRNTIARDAELRTRAHNYWLEEGRIVAEAMDDKEVVEGVNNALSLRINISAITKDAELYAKNLIGSMEPAGSA